jgi:uncharacterized HAD superfamily protein
MKIAIDLDEVLADFSGTFLELYNQTYGTNWKKDMLYSYTFEEVFGKSIDEILSLIYKMYDLKLDQTIKPIKGAKEAVKKLKDKHTLFVITSRQNDFEKQTKEWVQKHFPNTFEKVILTNYFSRHGVEKTKAEVCDELGIDLFIDDQSKYCNVCVSKERVVFLFDAIWNKKDSLKSEIIRVKNWEEIIDNIHKLDKD